VASPNSPPDVVSFDSVFFELLLAPVLVSAGQGLSGACINPLYQSPSERVKPLGDLLSEAEGGYDSVNRGRAGDTPGGMVSLGGRRLADHKVSEVIRLQSRNIYAVGRYQFVPTTLLKAVEWAGVSGEDKFSEEVQDRLFLAILRNKRPAIIQYLRGEHSDETLALDELAREWASVEYRNNRGYYDGLGGNRAKISRKEALSVLRKIKKSWVGLPPGLS